MTKEITLGIGADNKKYVVKTVFPKHGSGTLVEYFDLVEKDTGNLIGRFSSFEAAKWEAEEHFNYTQQHDNVGFIN